MQLTKKGDMTWDEIGKLLIALAVLLFLIVVAWLLRDKMLSLFDKFKMLLRFGI